MSLAGGDSFRSLLLLHPFVRIQLVFTGNSSIQIPTGELGVFGDFPNQIEVLKVAQLHDLSSLPKLADMADNNDTHGHGASSRYGRSLFMHAWGDGTNVRYSSSV